jgi:exopolyphosphatase / guanosine-5'-triphosphate,3'-diphosphate pyrophosphatase
MYEHVGEQGGVARDDVRRTAVVNAAERFGYEREHCETVARLALAVFDGTARLGLHDGDLVERELIWASAMLHDVGVLVDYSAHHRHSAYLVLNTGLPGFDHRELAIIAMLVRGHRKGGPDAEPFAAVLRPGDQAVADRGAACLRLAEQLDRARAGEVRDLVVRAHGGELGIGVVCDGDPRLAMWSAEREAPAVERAFGRRLRLEGL